MSEVSDRLLLWGPRVLGVLMGVFLGLFALDAFSPSRSILAALPDFFIHLIPAMTVMALVIVSWRREWIGGLAFIAFAIMYTLSVGRRNVDWVLLISGPLLTVGALFLWSWHRRRVLRPS
jgi:uncharacterized membrane protein